MKESINITLTLSKREKFTDLDVIDLRPWCPVPRLVTLVRHFFFLLHLHDIYSQSKSVLLSLMWSIKLSSQLLRWTNFPKPPTSPFVPCTFKMSLSLKSFVECKNPDPLVYLLQWSWTSKPFLCTSRLWVWRLPPHGNRPQPRRLWLSFRGVYLRVLLPRPVDVDHRGFPVVLRPIPTRPVSTFVLGLRRRPRFWTLSTMSVVVGLLIPVPSFIREEGGSRTV